MKHGFRVGLLSLGAAGVAAMAWSQPSAIILLVILPVLLTGAQRRADAAIIMLGYFGFNSLGLPSILLKFFGGEYLLLAFAAPVLLALLLSAPFLLINPSARRPIRALQAGAAFAAISLPPLGFVGWLNPLFAAGALFPGIGLAGLLLTLVCFSVAASARLASRNDTLTVLSGLALLFAVYGLTRAESPPAPPGLVGVDTALGMPEATLDYRREAWQTILGVVEREREAGAALIVFPESILHDFADVDLLGLRQLASASPADPLVWIGATIRGGDGRLLNALIRPDGSVVDSSRLPVPVGNWRPFLRSGVVANPFGTDLVRTDDRVIAVSICYEDGVLWPHPGLLTGRSDALVSVSNHWALADTRTAQAQYVAATALARMGGVPLVRSVNE